MSPLDEATEEKVINEFKNLNENNSVNNRFYYLKGMYDHAEEEYDDDSLILTSCLLVMCQAIAEHTTQDATKLFNRTSSDEALASYIALLLNKAISS